MNRFILTFRKLPAYVQFIFAAITIAVVGGKGLFGFQVSGLTWFVPLIVSLVFLFTRFDKVTFPWMLWAPWGVLLGFWLIYSDFPALQRTAQLLCPLVVGMCASTLPVSEKLVSNFIKFCRSFALILGAICIGKSGLTFMGAIPFNPGLAAELMAGLLFSAMFAASYAYGNRKDLLLWVFLLTLPVYGLYRSGIAVAGSTLPFTFAPLSLAKRILFLGAAIPVALVIFYLPTVQNEMFYSGRGTIQDLFSEDFATSGRKLMWEVVDRKADQAPVFGHGTGACEDLVLKLTGGLRYPHNDWLLTRYDYGYLGMIIFALTILASLFHALFRAAKAKSVEVKILFQTGAFSFVILALMMLTDNIMVYASFFGNLQFMILGLAYASTRNTLASRRGSRL